MRNRIFIIIGIVVLYILLRIIIPEKDIEIGFIGDFTGYSSGFGEQARNGAQLAVDEINRSGGYKGRKFKLTVRDNKNDQVISGRIVDEFLSNGTIVIIGPLLSRMANIVIEKTKGKECLVISPTVSTGEIGGLDDNFIRINSSAESDGERIFSAIKKRGDKTIVLVKSALNKEYTSSFMDGIKKETINSEIRIVKEYNFEDESQFKEIAQELNSINPDGVVFSCRGKEAAGLIQKYIKLNGKANLYGGQWVKATDILIYGGSTIEGMILVGSYQSRYQSSKEKEFRDKYLKIYSAEPHFSSEYTYESVMLFYESLLKADTLSINKIKNEILHMESFKGISEQFSFNKYGDADRRKTLVVVKGSEYVLFAE